MSERFVLLSDVPAVASRHCWPRFGSAGTMSSKSLGVGL